MNRILSPMPAPRHIDLKMRCCYPQVAAPELLRYEPM